MTTFLSPLGAGSTIAAQTFIAGHGTDFVNVANSGGDQIDFSVGGTDTVQFFSALATGNHPLADLGPPTALNIFNNVLGFTAAHDSININTANSYLVHRWWLGCHTHSASNDSGDGA